MNRSSETLPVSQDKEDSPKSTDENVTMMVHVEDLDSEPVTMPKTKADSIFNLKFNQKRKGPSLIDQW